MDETKWIETVAIHLSTVDPFIDGRDEILIPMPGTPAGPGMKVAERLHELRPDWKTEFFPRINSQLLIKRNRPSTVVQ